MPIRKAAERGPTIVALRALPGLGDFLCSIPALRALREAHPHAWVHLIGLEACRLLAERFARYIDVFHAYPGHIGIEDGPLADPGDRDAFVARIRALRPDLAIQLHGAGDRTNDLVARFGATRVLGFHPREEPPPQDGTFLPWAAAEPEARRWLRLVRTAGVADSADSAGPAGAPAAADERLEFPLDPAAAPRADALLGPVGTGPYVVVHPGSARPQSRWSVEGFIATATSIAAGGLAVVVTGAREEQALAAAVAGATGGLSLAGRTDLDELGWIVSRARLVIANDTGLSHLAAALGVPSVVVFTEPSLEHRLRWAPVNRGRHRPVSASLPEVLRAADSLLHRPEVPA
jgi:ADP-heptose:LPS heptosyltransferase